MSEKFKEPKARRLGTRPLITAGFVGALMLGMIVITPAGSGLFAPDRLDGSDVGKLKQDIAYCRVPDGSCIAWGASLQAGSNRGTRAGRRAGEVADDRLPRSALPANSNSSFQNDADYSSGDPGGVPGHFTAASVCRRC
jgi:hypothetical protein